MGRWLILAVLVLPSASSAQVSKAATCTSSYIYRLDEGQSERGGWESKDGQITVRADPRLELHGPFGMLVCTNGNTTIEFWKP